MNFVVSSSFQRLGYPEFKDLRGLKGTSWFRPAYKDLIASSFRDGGKWKAFTRLVVLGADGYKLERGEKWMGPHRIRSEKSLNTAHFKLQWLFLQVHFCYCSWSDGLQKIANS